MGKKVTSLNPDMVDDLVCMFALWLHGMSLVFTQTPKHALKSSGDTKLPLGVSVRMCVSVLWWTSNPSRVY